MCIYVCWNLLLLLLLLLLFYIYIFFSFLFFFLCHYIAYMFIVIMLWAASIDGHLSSLVACHCTYLYLFNLFVHLANKLSLSLSLSLHRRSVIYLLVAFIVLYFLRNKMILMMMMTTMMMITTMTSMLLKDTNRERSVMWSVQYVRRSAVPSTRPQRTSFSSRRPTTRFYCDVCKARTLHGLGRSAASTDSGPPTTVAELTAGRTTSWFHQLTPVVGRPEAWTTKVGLFNFALVVYLDDE